MCSSDLAWVDTQLFTRNRLARHDGPLSVLRSFTTDEFRAMTRSAGLRGVEIQRHPMFRVALVRWPPTGDAEPVTARPRDRATASGVR